MIEVQLPNTQITDSTDTALTASSDVLSAAGFSVADLFSPGANYESAMSMLQANGIESEEATAMVAFAQGLASENEEAIDAFSTALERYHLAKQKNSSTYVEIAELYESDEQVRSDADAFADLLSKLFGENFTGDSVLGGVSISTSFFSSEGSSKKKRIRTAVLLALMLSACAAPEAPKVQVEIIFNGEYVLQADRTPIGSPMSGLLSDKDGNLIDARGRIITPVQQGDQFRYDGVSATKNKFQFASAEAISKNDPNKVGNVITLRQINENSVADVELYLAQTDNPNVYNLIDQYNNSGLYTITLNGNKIILTDIASQQHYLITDATFVNDVATPDATDSPEMLIQKIKDMFALYTVAQAKGLDVTPVVLPTEASTDAPSSTPTATPANAESAQDSDVPTGYTIDANGDYTRIDAESGKTIYWDAERNAEYSLMFDDMLWDQPPELEASTLPDGETNLSDQLRLRVFIDPAIQNWNKLSVTHSENMDPKNTQNWTMFFKSALLDAMTAKGLIKDPTDFSYETWFHTDDYTIPYTTKEGPQSLILKDGNTTTVHIRSDYEALLADIDTNNYTLVEGANLGSPAMKYVVKISSDEDGNTFVEIAPSIADATAWSNERIIEMYLLGLTSPLTFVDLPYTPRSSSMGAYLAKNHKAYPYFEFTRVK